MTQETLFNCFFIMAAYDCDLCGCSGFGNAGALASHKATSRTCKLARVQRRAYTQERQEPLLDHPTADDYISMSQPPDPGIGTSNTQRDFGPMLSIPFNDFCKASQPISRFDSTLHMVAFIRQCRNSLGLSVRDTQKLLGILFHPEFSLEDMKVKNLSDLRRYEATIFSKEEPGWTEVTLRPKDAHVPPLVLHYQDPVQVVSRLFSDPRNRSGFKLSPNSEVPNTYSSPDTGEWWKHMQVRIISFIWTSTLPLTKTFDKVSTISYICSNYVLCSFSGPCLSWGSHRCSYFVFGPNIIGKQQKSEWVSINDIIGQY